MKQVDDKSFPRMRGSACADASLRAEIERLKKMTPLERANAALGMGKIFEEGEPSALKLGEDHER
jgi:hypothetical protein